MIHRAFSGLKPGDVRNIIVDVTLMFYSISFAVEKFVIQDWLWFFVYGGFSITATSVFVWDMYMDLKEMKKQSA